MPPKTHAQPLQPIAFEVIALGDNENKVFFQRGAEYAEMYINIRDDRHLELVPKDEDYAPALADMFADALRDGPAPPRTKATDPSLETEEPRYALGRELEVEGTHEPACLGDGWLVFEPRGKGEVVRFAKWGAETTSVCEVPGAVDALAVAARAPVAVALITARDPRSSVVGGKQTSTLWVVEPVGCRALATPKDLKLGPFEDLHLSRSGRELALTDGEQLVTLPLGNGKPARTPIPELSLVYTWDDDGIQLHDLKHNRSHVTAGAAPVAIDHHSTVSPDGAYTATFLDGAIDVTTRATKQTRTFRPTFRSDLRAIERADAEAPHWIAPHSLVLRGSPDLALDAATLRTRPLSEPGTSVACTSPDGAHALLERDSVLHEAK